MLLSIFSFFLAISLVSSRSVPTENESHRFNGAPLTSFAGTLPLPLRETEGNDNVAARGLFYWYLPAERFTEKTPLLIWLQGGPGASSMTSLFHGHGPFYLENGTIKLKESKERVFPDWPQLYIDQPVGSGLSYVIQKDNAEPLTRSEVLRTVTEEYTRDYHRGYAVSQKAIAQ